MSVCMLFDDIGGHWEGGGGQMVAFPCAPCPCPHVGCPASDAYTGVNAYMSPIILRIESNKRNKDNLCL
jgi:hypothetical protein